jgi:hypothetical protein
MGKNQLMTKALESAMQRPAALAAGDALPSALINAQSVVSGLDVIPLANIRTARLFEHAKREEGQDVLCMSFARDGVAFLHDKVRKAGMLPERFLTVAKLPTGGKDCTKCKFGQIGSRPKVYGADAGNGRACHFRRVIPAVEYAPLKNGEVRLVLISAPPTSERSSNAAMEDIVRKHGREAVLWHYIVRLKKVLAPHPGIATELIGELDEDASRVMDALRDKITPRLPGMVMNDGVDDSEFTL